MKRTLKPITSMLALAALVFVPAACRADPTARQAIQTAHVKIDTALDRKEYFAITSACAPTFVSINEKGQRFTAADVRIGLERQLAYARHIESTTQIGSFNMTSGGAIVVISQHLAVETPYKALFFGRVAHTTVDQTRREEWALADGIWQLKQSTTLSSRTRTRY